MKGFVLLFLATAANPISKVLQLLSELQQKVLKEGEAEQKQYEAFSEWCEDSAVAKQYEIKDGKAAKESLEATILKETATVANLESSIADLASTITTNEADLAAAQQIRDMEAKDFAKADADLAETIDMLSRTVGIIAKNKNGSFLQGSAPAQLQAALAELVTAASVQTQDKDKLQALIQSTQNSDDDFLSRSAPDAAAYENHSGSILDVLEDMQDKASEQRHAAQKTEMNQKHNFELLAQSLNDAVKNDNKAMAADKQNKASSEEAKAIAEGDLSVATKELANDKKDLADLSQDCQQKASDWSESQASRSAELQALLMRRTSSPRRRAPGRIGRMGCFRLSRWRTRRARRRIRFCRSCRPCRSRAVTWRWRSSRCVCRRRSPMAATCSVRSRD